MGADAKILVRGIGGEAIERAGHHAEPHGEWLALTSADDEDVASALSETLGAETVWWSIHTAVDQIWIKAFDRGRPVREIRYSADEGWAANEGRRLPFENADALLRWQTRRRVLASPDGYDVLACFLGESRGPIEAAVEADATASFFLPASIVAEARAAAAERGASLSQVLASAWALGRVPLFEREAGDMPERPVLDVVLTASDGGEARPVPPIDTSGERVECFVAFTAQTIREIDAMVMAFDRPMSWLLREAYLLARPRLLGRTT